LSEANESSHNTSGRSRRKNEVVRREAEWNPTVPNRITVNETRNDGTTNQREFEVARVDDSPTRNASRNDTLADFRRNRLRINEVNSATNTANQADNERDTSDN
jgi:hypothetical protein